MRFSFLIFIFLFGCSVDQFVTIPNDVPDNSDASPDAGKLITLASHQSQPGKIVLDSEFIYWINELNGTIMKCSIDKCDSPIILAKNQATPHGLVVDKYNIYWTSISTGDIHMCSLNGCDSGNTVLATNQSSPWDLSIKNNFLYWTNSGGGTSGNQIIRCNLNDCANSLFSVSEQQNPYPLLVTNDMAVWSNINSIASCSLNASCGSKPQSMGTAFKNITSLASFNSDLFFTDLDAGVIYKCASSNCSNTVTKLASQQTKPYQIVSDSANIYWINLGDNSIMSCSHDCITPTVMFINGGTPKSIAVDDNFVYWSDSTNNTIMKLKK